MRIICLATPVEEPDRVARAQAHFAERGVPISGYAMGLHKTTSGLTTTHPYMVDRPDPDAPRYVMGPHPTNIWIGHYLVWNALILSGDPAWCVLECDAKFPPDWRPRVEQAFHEAPADWDLIYLGSCCTAGRQATPVLGTTTLYQIAGTAPQCNHAYALTRAAAEILVTTLRKVWAPIDIQQASECWGSPLPRCVPPVAPPVRPLQVYTVLPRIIDQWDTDLGV